MRYARISAGGRAVWGRVGERDIELLSGSPWRRTTSTSSAPCRARARTGCHPSSRPSSTPSA
ncbi:Rv2993c-like domain-containing protein [Streptomyces sp. CA-100214]